MSVRRLWTVCRLDLAHNARRPLFWSMIVILALMIWGLASGGAQISTGDSSVGGKKAWITSEFSIAQQISALVFLIYNFFLAIAAGMSVIRDDEQKVGELLHTSSLRPSEYVWGKFLAVALSFTGVLALHLVLAALFNHVLPLGNPKEILGPFVLGNYLVPALVFGVPVILFFGGTSFAVGEMTRRPVLVFVLPVALLLGCGFFLWSWSPDWLDPRVNRALMLIDPSGLRWLVETWIKVDRGVDFYNQGAIGFDGPFLASRAAFVAAGLGCVALSARHLARSLRGARVSKASLAKARAAVAAPFAEPTARPLAALAMTNAPLGWIAQAIEVARVELRELRSSPGLYLFTPLILLQAVQLAFLRVGPFGTPLLATAGTLAAGSVNTLSLLICLLILFYAVESLQRERSAGLASISYATPVRTSAFLFGKSVANSVVGAAILVAALVTELACLAIQGRVPIELRPFFLVWGLLLIPTFLLWSSFITAAYGITRNRYAAYAIGLGALAITGILQFRNKMNWVGNWNLWGAVRWSDLGPLELDRSALVMNRALALAAAAFFTVLAVRFFGRRELDAASLAVRLRPGALVKGALRLWPAWVPATVLASVLGVSVSRGYQGSEAEKLAKDYWRKNVETWKDAPLPDVVSVDVDLEVDPARRWLHSKGTARFVNRKPHAIAQVPLTGGLHWENLAWTMNGSPVKPDERCRLYVFTPPTPLAPGDPLSIGFDFEGTFPKGISRNGGGASEFVLPSGVVLTSFTTSFLPLPGFLEDVGIDEDNRTESKVYPDDLYKSVVEPFVGTGSRFTTRVAITGPEDFTLNSVGVKTRDDVKDGKRTAVWESDSPVTFFNVVGGRRIVKTGEGTQLWYHPMHAYNVDEMSLALDAARRDYSEWFYPYPWRELKLTEFPNLATYAQGFPTNISFSDGIGFLAKSDPRSPAAFAITAHESAHQWWGNILVPGKGPGGNILSEGMSHFSTILLVEHVKGLQERIEWCKRIEDGYGRDRQIDSERALVKIDGSRAGDTTVTYDKGGWVMWMLMQRMGRARALEGLHAFIEKFHDNEDHPLMQDLVETLRPYAPDAASYDDFVKQWIFDVVVPEYRLSDAKRTESSIVEASHALEGDGPASAHAPAEWTVTTHVENLGSGRMPVEIAAAAGTRFQDDGKLDPKYRDARATVELGAGESRDVTIRCGFKPERVEIDPDALVLQLRRNAAIVRF